MRAGTLPILVSVVVAVSVAFALDTATPRSQQIGAETSGSQSELLSKEDVAVGPPYEWSGPKYPKQARRNKVQGSVTLRLSLDEKGRVTNTSVLSGDPELTDAVLRVIRKWKYAPYFRDGKPVQITTVVAINFNLTDSGQPAITATYPGYRAPAAVQVFKVGNGVSAPRLIHSPDPEYTEEARQAKYQGTCVLALVVGPDGRPYNIHVTRALGNGLDEKAIEAVNQWRFSPAMKDDRPVAVLINVEIQFRLH